MLNEKWYQNRQLDSTSGQHLAPAVRQACSGERRDARLTSGIPCFLLDLRLYATIAIAQSFQNTKIHVVADEVCRTVSRQGMCSADME